MRGDDRIAIVGIGLRYPDADSPGELWENVLSGRRPFRDRPVRNERPAAHEINRLALDVVSVALADAGFRDGDGLPRPATAVVLGNNLLGTDDIAIAGEICDHFDFGGGGFAVGDGGSSALMAVATAADALADHDVDVAIAGCVGQCVDLADEFDGAGLLVMMRAADAIAQHRRSYAWITGSGVSSDDLDHGGSDGHQLAIAGAAAVSSARLAADLTSRPAVLGTATGLAGLIRAVLAVYHQVIPPSADHNDAVLWPEDRPIRAGVSARGTSGITTHVTIEEPHGRARRSGLCRRTVALVAGRQDAEVLLLDAPDIAGLRAKVARLAALAPRLAHAQLTDVAGILAAEESGQPVRAAVVATGPSDAHRKLIRLLDELDSGQHTVFAATDGIFLGHRAAPPRIAYLFPDQGSGNRVVGAIQRRFALADNIFRIAGEPAYAGRPATWTPTACATASCAVVASLAATRVLGALGIEADLAVGPGLGELTALAWGGALGGGELLRLAAMAAEPPADTAIGPLTRTVVSTVTGRPLDRDADVRALTRDRLSHPVHGDTATVAAVTAAVTGADLAVEVGTGHTLSELVGRIASATPVLSIDMGSQSSVPLLRVVGAAHAIGVALDTTMLFAGRVIRALPADLDPAIPPGPVRSVPAGTDDVPGVAPWVSAFSVDYVRTTGPALPIGGAGSSAWSVFASPGHPLAEPLRSALATVDGGGGVGAGVLLCLPDSGEDHIDLIVAARAAVTPGRRFVVVGHRFGANAAARTLHKAMPSVATTVVDLADPTPVDAHLVDSAVRRVVAEVAATVDIVEARYDTDGNRTVPVLRALPPEAGVIVSSPLGTTDVLLVTGGGRGIVAECALAVAKDSGARIALIGRSDPAVDIELAANLARMSSAGVRVWYERADVTSAEQVLAAVGRIEADLGTVTAILHGVGCHEAAPPDLDVASFRRAVAPKVFGLRAVLAAVHPDRIKLLVTFGSIAGRAGPCDEPQHVTADDWSRELTVQFGLAYPRSRAVAVAWSVWSGPERADVTPISTDGAIATLRRILADPTVGPELLVSGRAAGLAALAGPSALPGTRFVDRVLVHYPGVELVTEADLHADTDPYLADHPSDGEPSFPMALGIEAIAQAAAALTGWRDPAVLENVEFGLPIPVPPSGSTTIRTAVLVRDTETVDAVVRSGRTGFGTDHIRARLRLPRPVVPATHPRSALLLPTVPIDPITELYGGILPQGKQFQRLLGYRRISAAHVVAEVSTTSPTPWFAPALSQELVTADPGTRDAVMQTVQACVPDATLVPLGVARLHLSARNGQDTEYVVVDARERRSDDETCCYDVDVFDPAGTVVERWEGLTFRTVRTGERHGPWVPALLGPYIERTVRQVFGGHPAVVVEPDPTPWIPGADLDQRGTADLAASRAFGHPVRLRYGPDGQPDMVGASVSLARDAGLTLLVAGRGRLGCHVGTALGRTPADWADLLGDHVVVRDRLTAASGESAAAAGARVLAALVALRKSGVPPTGALTVDLDQPDGWVLLGTAVATVATWVTNVAGRPDPVVFAVLSGTRR